MKTKTTYNRDRMKTLKDIPARFLGDGFKISDVIYREDLRQSAIEWIKYYNNLLEHPAVLHKDEPYTIPEIKATMNWIINFFNLNPLKSGTDFSYCRTIAQFQDAIRHKKEKMKDIVEPIIVSKELVNEFIKQLNYEKIRIESSTLFGMKFKIKKELKDNEFELKFWL